MRAVIAVVAIVLLLVAGSLWFLERSENPRSSFATFSEMEAAGLIAAGWLPEFLPRSARQIEETYNIDTNEVSATFTYDVGDVQSVEAACDKVAQSERGAEYTCRTRYGQIATLLLGSDGIAYYKSSPHGV
jgi:hypothetical protein